MSARENAHVLLNQIPEDALPAVARYLEAVPAGCPPADPFDDEPLSPEEQAMMAASREDIARGDVVSHEEVAVRIAAQKERA
jgi:hypothetical protein